MSRKLLSPDDLYGFQWVSDVQLSPDSSRVAYVLTEIDRESDEYRSAVYVAPSDGSEQPRRYTYGPKKDSSPRWSPDGRHLLFLSDRDETNQAYIMPADGGEARKLTDLENGVSCPVWAPDNHRIAFISSTGVNSKEEVKDITAYHFTEAHFKEDGSGIKRGRRHLFVQSVESGRAEQLTHGDDDYSDPAWSPDGTLIAAVSTQLPDREFVNVSDVYLVPAGGGEPRRLTPQRGPSYQPVFSRDGAYVVYAGHQNPPETGLNTQDALWKVSLGGDEPQCLTEGWDYSIGNSVNSDARWGSYNTAPVWPSGDHIYFVADDHGAAHVYRISAEGGVPEPVVTGNRSIDSISAVGGRLAFIAGEPLNPGDVYTAAVDGGDEVRLTHVNELYLSRFELSEPEEISLRSADGTELQGWVIKPAGFEEGGKYPLIVEVHGGPATQYGYTFFHEFQVLAARGYGVIYINPRGSLGYGQQFVACISKAWGELDYADITAAADYAASLPWVDTERMGITGGSYGGFMTNWVVGHTDRFKAAVTQRSVTNFASFYGTSDIGPMFSEWQVGGTPWDNAEGYARMSPITYLPQMRTPLLVIHSEEDHRCPIEQGEQLFVGLKRLGVETELLRFPQESHGLSRGGKPKRRVERLERIAGWFECYMPANAAQG